ncbi:MAG: capsular biosynthesis protein [Verrucomicrobia bacterium]|nr:MAG: capsular biosynthesis protein [Verrucomicrobiota bacterium]
MDPIKAAAPQDSKLHFLDYWRIIRIRKAIILAVFLLVVITTVVVTFIYPESFSGTARIRVERDQSDISGVLQGQAFPSSYDPYYINTEFELIQSEVILQPVITKLDLNKVWGAKYGPNGAPLQSTDTMKLLQARMGLQPVRNTSLIEIRVTTDKPEEAAKLANEIAQAYCDYRVEHRKQMTMGGVDALEKKFTEQQGKVSEAQSNVDVLRFKLQISDPVVTENTPGTLMTGDTLRRFESLRIEGLRELVSQQTLLDKLLAFSPKDVVNVLPTVIPDATLTSWLEQRNMLQQRFIALTNILGERHADVVTVQSQLDDLNAKIAAKATGILQGVQTRVAAVKDSLAKLEHEVDQAMTNDLVKAVQSQPYFEAKRKVEEAETKLKLLTMKIYTEKLDNELPKTAMAFITTHAVPDAHAVRPNKPFNIALGIIVGLVVGVGLAFFIEYLDTSVKTIDDVERSLNSPVLGVIPQNVGAILDEGAESPHAEAYRVLRTNLLFSRKDDKLNTVAIVSAGAGEGKSTTVFNLAAVFAQGGQRVLIVDSDLRRPTLHKMLRVSNHIGLTNYLLKQNTVEEVIQTTSLPTLDFMASGKLPSSSLGILNSPQMKELIGQLKQHYDFVFFDSPPVMGVSDASIIASEVDMTLQVIQYRRYPQPLNIRAKQLIEKVGGNLVGIVLNNINMSQDENYYYYSGYYHEEGTNDEEQEAAPGGPASQKS